MSVQMTTIEVDQSTAAILKTLKAEAETQGKTLAALLKPLLPTNGRNSEETLTAIEQKEERPFYDTATPEEWIGELNAWAASHDPNTPVILDVQQAVFADEVGLLHNLLAQFAADVVSHDCKS